MAQYFRPYNRFLPNLFAAAHRAFVAAAMRFRAAADMPRRRVGVDVFMVAGGRPRRLVPNPPVPSRACIAASSLLRSAFSCRTISSTFIRLS